MNDQADTPATTPQVTEPAKPLVFRLIPLHKKSKVSKAKLVQLSRRTRIKRHRIALERHQAALILLQNEIKLMLGHTTSVLEALKPLELPLVPCAE